MAADSPVDQMMPRPACHGAFERVVPIRQEFSGSCDEQVEEEDLQAYDTCHTMMNAQILAAA